MKMFQTLTSSSSGFFSSRSSFSPISTSTSFRVSPRFLKRAGSPLAVLLQTNNFKELLFRSARSSNYLIALLTLQPHSTVIFLQKHSMYIRNSWKGLDLCCPGKKISYSYPF